MIYFRLIATFFLLISPVFGHLEADGVGFVPVVVFITYGDTGITKGMEVRLVDAGEDSKPDPDDLGPIRNLYVNLGKPVLTDINSTAVVWLFGGWSGSAGIRHRTISGRLIVGPPEAPMFSGLLRDIIVDLKKAESSADPIFVTVKLKKAP